MSVLLDRRCANITFKCVPLEMVKDLVERKEGQSRVYVTVPSAVSEERNCAAIYLAV